jgi:hypothetical protein
MSINIETALENSLANFRVEDDLAPLQFIERNGYYRVGDKNFNFKINALEEASRTQQSVEWEFNTSVFKKLNWRVDTNVGLNNLYRMRAQQLRNKYDYLVLSFSGGCDSYTVLRSFIDNDIKLDEVICDWPINYTESNHHTSDDRRPENYLSEWELAIKPVLKYLSIHHPEIKITTTDTLPELTIEDYEDTCTITNIHNYISIKRWRGLLTRYQTLIDNHDKVAVVLGIDKPRVHIQKNIFCVLFSDEPCWVKSSITAGYTRNIEYFFWTPDLPEIVLEQAHTIYQYLKYNKEILASLSDGPLSNRDFISKLIYSEWNPNTFQATKPSSVINNEHYWWLEAHRQTLALQSFKSSLNSRLSMVDNKYWLPQLNNNFNGFNHLFSRLYPIGKLL